MKNKKFLNAVVPLMMLGAPPLVASSIRSGSRFRTKSSIVQSEVESNSLTPQPQTRVENPFGGFGGSSIEKAVIPEQVDVLAFLTEEGLLTPTGEKQSIIDKSISFQERRVFLSTTTISCIKSATYNMHPLISIYSYISSSSTSSFSVYYSNSGKRIAKNISEKVFNYYKPICEEGIRPIAKDVSFTGILETGETLTGSYTYEDHTGDTESGTLYQWYRSDDVAGTNKASIAGATSLTYTLTIADEGKYISFEVTPKNALPEIGDVVESPLNPSAVKVKHEMEVGGKTTVVTSPIAGVETERLANGGLVTTSGHVDLGNGYHLVAVAETTPDGKTTTRFMRISDTDPTDKAIVGYTYTAGTPFQIGSTIVISEIDGKLTISITSPLNGETLIVE